MRKSGMSNDRIGKLYGLSGTRVQQIVARERAKEKT
jgi:hypothetical protein